MVHRRHHRQRLGQRVKRQDSGDQAAGADADKPGRKRRPGGPGGAGGGAAGAAGRNRTRGGAGGIGSVLICELGDEGLCFLYMTRFFNY